MALRGELGDQAGRPALLGGQALSFGDRDDPQPPRRVPADGETGQVGDLRAHQRGRVAGRGGGGGGGGGTRPPCPRRGGRVPGASTRPPVGGVPNKVPARQGYWASHRNTRAASRLGMVVAIASSIRAQALGSSIACSTTGIRWQLMPIVDSTV